ncbi:MAG: hypothetical protein K0U37_04730 [Gammaproteobacteria bacterium]|nr:hypothetical protein [Gammaproteobacteria bacterium]
MKRTPQQKKLHEGILEKLAFTYMEFTNPRLSSHSDDWYDHWREDIQGKLSLLSGLADPSEAKRTAQHILNVITLGLVGEDEIDQDNAETACQMIQELYQHDPTLKAAIDEALSSKTISQRLSEGTMSLKDLLLNKRQLIDESLGKAPLEDDPALIRKRDEQPPSRFRKTDLQSIRAYNAEAKAALQTQDTPQAKSNAEYKNRYMQTTQSTDKTNTEPDQTSNEDSTPTGP